MQKAQVLRYEINTSTLSRIIYVLKISESIEWADDIKCSEKLAAGFQTYICTFLYHNSTFLFQ